MRGKSSSRGRGRGRGGNRGRGSKRPTFDSARIGQQRQEDSHNSGSEESDLGNDSEATSDTEHSSEEDDEPTKSVPAFTALLQSLSSENRIQERPSKRRKTTDENQELDDQTGGDMVIDPGTIDEPEEGHGSDHSDAGDAGDAEDDGEDEETQNVSDPFIVHFAEPDVKTLFTYVKAVQQGDTRSVLLPAHEGHKMTVESPHVEGLPDIKDPGGSFSRTSLQLNSRLIEPAARAIPSFDSLETHISPYLFEYRDIMFCDRTLQNADSLRTLYCLHVLNHLFKTRNRVIKHNARLSKSAADDELEFRDQGFTRPKTLILLPTRQSCVKVVDTIIKLCEPEQQENRKRFQDAYSETTEKYSADKPADFRGLFDGNDDDMFRVGLKFTRKTVKFFSQFYNSDIIFASPLGLRMAIDNEDEKKRDYDFLSSIEMVIVDQADAMLMQNWDHVEYIFDHLNLQPKEAHGCDFSRVHNWYLDGNARHLRQTLVFSGFLTPEMNRLYPNQMKSVRGKMKYTPTYKGEITNLGVHIKQTFSRVASSSPTTDPDSRFDYFKSAIVPTLLKGVRAAASSREPLGVLIFIPSYLDFVVVRNYFATSSTTQNVSFGAISEYSSVKEVARARSHFTTGRHSILLYTERAHHFRRYRIRGVKKVIMYGLPDNPIFYREIVGEYLNSTIGAGSIAARDASVRCMFTKWDMLKLQRIAGQGRCAVMLKEKGGDTFDFV